jgi:1-acyl-sn-glycerol-3-phosphate acyltransferase
MIRRLKGLYMALMFLLFGIGIVLELLVLPLLSFVALLRGPDPRRMERAHRVLMKLWLWGMQAGRLLAIAPPVGQPVDGPSVIVANHPGLFDVMVLIRDIPNMSVMVKPSLVRSLPLGPIFRMCGYTLAPKSGSTGNAMGSLLEAERHLKNGRRFLLFPEGTRSPKGALLPFNPGAFWIARRAGAPIQPVVIRNAPPFIPHEYRWYLPPRERSRFVVEFLDPIPPPARGHEAAAAAALTARYREILDLDTSETPRQDDQARQVVMHPPAKPGALLM